MGETVELVLIDGSPAYVATHTGSHKAKRTNTTQESNEADALSYFTVLFKDVDQTKAIIFSFRCTNYYLWITISAFLINFRYRVKCNQ